MSQQNRLFRKVSLERLSSPEQLDRLLEVVSPRGWLALLTVFLALAAGLTWGFLGNLPSKVEGQGILIRGCSVLDVVSEHSGRLEQILVRSGDLVEEGQVIARLNQAALEVQITNQKVQLESFQNQDEALRIVENRNQSLEAENLEEQTTSIRETIRNFRQQADFLESRIESQEQLAEAGLLTQATVLETRSTFFSVQQEIAAAQAQIQNLEIQRLEGEKRVQQERNRRALEIEQTRLSLEELKAQRARSTEIVSPHEGRVLQVMTSEGNLVDAGTSVLTMELTDPELQLVAFLPPADGKRVVPGMEVNITPTTVKPEEYGYLRGRVVDVSAFPSTPQGMMRILRNDSLVQQMSARGSPIEVVVEPITDPDTPSGFEWTSRRGPDQPIVAGTLAFASVVVEERRPITLVVPLLRRWFLGVETPSED
ncbi:MAG: NHLP bacteriocin system secretion protein [Opitutales bacterium]|nr:NHLP bacteriocin system secretion protein [Opitutales bacterium]